MKVNEIEPGVINSAMSRPAKARWFYLKGFRRDDFYADLIPALPPEAYKINEASKLPEIIGDWAGFVTDRNYGFEDSSNVRFGTPSSIARWKSYVSDLPYPDGGTNMPGPPQPNQPPLPNQSGSGNNGILNTLLQMELLKSLLGSRKKSNNLSKAKLRRMRRRRLRQMMKEGKE